MNSNPNSGVSKPFHQHQHPLSRSKKKCSKPRICREEQHIIHPTLVTTKELCVIKTELNNNYSLRLPKNTPTLPPSFFNMFKNLRLLDLRKVGLRILPPQIIQLKNLQKLDLRDNNLTYLPSQIAQLPNLHQLQIENVRNRRDKLLKEVNIATDNMVNAEGNCSCKVRSDGQEISPLPTLGQLCTQAILCAIPNIATHNTEGLSWEELEPFYSTGKFEEIPDHILPFPSHLLPSYIPIDICSACSEPVMPAHAQFDKLEVVALCRVRLRFVFCSHKCYSKVIQQWENERIEEEEKKLLRQHRFHTKNHE